MPRGFAAWLRALVAAQAQVGRRPLADIWPTGWSETGGLDRDGRLGRPPGGGQRPGLPGPPGRRRNPGLPEATFAQADFNLPEAFQPPDPRAQDSPVEILTVHGAKGLEFHPGLSALSGLAALKGEDKTPPFLLEEIPGRDRYGLALARPYVQEKQSSLYLLLKDLKEPAPPGGGPAGLLRGGDPGPAASGHVRPREANQQGELQSLRGKPPGLAPGALPGSSCRRRGLP